MQNQSVAPPDILIKLNFSLTEERELRPLHCHHDENAMKVVTVGYVCTVHGCLHSAFKCICLPSSVLGPGEESSLPWDQADFMRTGEMNLSTLLSQSCSISRNMKVNVCTDILYFQMLYFPCHFPLHT